MNLWTCWKFKASKIAQADHKRMAPDRDLEHIHTINIGNLDACSTQGQTTKQFSLQHGKKEQVPCERKSDEIIV